MSGLLLVQRRADGRLSKAARLANGGVRVPAALTRTGVLEYRRHDGQVVREYRPPEEVFHADSLASLAGVPVTDRHPPEMVDPANFGRYTRGHVGESVRQDADHVAADVFVHAGDLLAKVDAGEAVEVSCGYTCAVDPTPGVTPSGERYDAVQRSIRYNHAALGPRGWGRAGASASLRLDAQGHELPPSGSTAAQERCDHMTIRIDGLDLDPTTPAFAQAFAKLQARADESAAKLAELGAEVTKQTARADAAESKAADLEAKLAEAASPARLDALVAERVQLATTAAKFLPASEKLDGLSADEIKRKVVEHNRKALKLDGKDAGYVAAVFDAIVSTDAPRTDGRSHTSDLRRHTSAPTTGAKRQIRMDRLTLATSNGSNG